MKQQAIQEAVEAHGAEIEAWLASQPADEQERLLAGGAFTLRQGIELALLPNSFLSFLAREPGESSTVELLQRIKTIKKAMI